MHLCLTVECITSVCFLYNPIQSPKKPPPPASTTPQYDTVDVVRQSQKCIQNNKQCIYGCRCDVVGCVGVVFAALCTSKLCKKHTGAPLNDVGMWG